MTTALALGLCSLVVAQIVHDDVFEQSGLDPFWSLGAKSQFDSVGRFSGEENNSIKVPLRVVQLVEDDGRAEFFGNDRIALTPATVGPIVSQMNRILAPTGITLLFDPLKDFELRRSSFLNRDFDPPAQGVRYLDASVRPPSRNTEPRFEGWLRMARERPDHLTIFARTGSSWRWDSRAAEWLYGTGPSYGDQDFIRVSSKSAYSWAHEVGHVFGLPHTDSGRSLSSVEAIQTAIDESEKGDPSRNPLHVIDGDIEMGILDTPPDPGATFWQSFSVRQSTIRVRINGRHQDLLISRENLMGEPNWKGGVSTLTPDQIAVMRHVARYWTGEEKGYPRNVRPSGAQIVEFEELNPTQNTGGRVYRRSMTDRFGVSDASELDLKQGQRITYRFKVDSPGFKKIWLLGLRGESHGTVRISLDGRHLKTLDLWSPRRHATGRMLLAELNLTASSYEISFSGDKKSRFSKGDLLGLDALAIEDAG